MKYSHGYMIVDRNKPLVNPVRLSVLPISRKKRHACENKRAENLFNKKLELEPGRKLDLPLTENAISSAAGGPK
jgi:hypothetical protein